MLTVLGRAAAATYRWTNAAALALAALLIAMTPASAQQPQRIVAVGDLHGDYDAWAQIARAAGIVDSRGHWAGGKTIFVQMGDVTDRGADSLKIVRSLQQLQREAPARGGRVVVILGNHEAMNVIGDYRYTTPGEYAAFADDQSPARRERTFELNRARLEANYRAKDPNMSPAAIRDAWLKDTPLGWVEHRQAWSPQGELGIWAANNPAIAKIDGTLFVHGGLSAEYSKLPLDTLNRRTMLAMRTGVGGANSILDDPLGPLWYRGLAMRDPDAEAARTGETGTRPTQAEELDGVLAAYGAQRMVIAHTPNLKGIVITNGGKLARIDTGISRYYGGPLTFLEIVGNQMIPHIVPRSAP
jgi:hypothetical protein